VAGKRNRTDETPHKRGFAFLGIDDAVLRRTPRDRAAEYVAQGGHCPQCDAERSERHPWSSFSSPRWNPDAPRGATMPSRPERGSS